MVAVYGRDHGPACRVIGLGHRVVQDCNCPGERHSVCALVSAGRVAGVPMNVTVIWDPAHRRYLARCGVGPNALFAVLEPVAWVDGRPVEWKRVTEYQPAKAEA